MGNSSGAYEKGRRGEIIASAYLEGIGYVISDVNYRSAYGEIDIIAHHGDCIVFVECKLRKSAEYGSPAQFVDKRKQSRIIKTALVYLADSKHVDKDIRFDIIELTGSHEYELNHIKNAFYGGYYEA